MKLCQICREKEATQKHHVSYLDPVLMIDVCVDCHKLIHRHDVGKAAGNEIIQDIHRTLPLLDTSLRLAYRCDECDTRRYLQQDLINALFISRDVRKPFGKCWECGTKGHYTLCLEKSGVASPTSIETLVRSEK